MNQRITIEIERNSLERVKSILNETYVNFNMLMQMVVNRVAEERSIDWIINRQSNTRQPRVEEGSNSDNLNQETNLPVNMIEDAVTRMTKSVAIRMFKGRDNIIHDHSVFASKNRSGHYYWANPNFDIVNHEWSLILNDIINKTLYLFYIPQNTYSRDDFVARTDNDNLIDMQIMYNDPTFTDNRSHISFRRYLVDSIRY